MSYIVRWFNRKAVDEICLLSDCLTKPSVEEPTETARNAAVGWRVAGQSVGNGTAGVAWRVFADYPCTTPAAFEPPGFADEEEVARTLTS
jgi:hypothetical protein